MENGKKIESMSLDGSNMAMAPGDALSLVKNKVVDSDSATKSSNKPGGIFHTAESPNTEPDDGSPPLVSVSNESCCNVADTSLPKRVEYSCGESNTIPIDIIMDTLYKMLFDPHTRSENTG